MNHRGRPINPQTESAMLIRIGQFEFETNLDYLFIRVPWVPQQ